MESTTIAISNHKGGVGKTTITAHLGAALSHDDNDVLLVDCDPQGTLSMHFTVNINSLKDYVDRNVFEINNYMFRVKVNDASDYLINLEKRLPSVYEAFYNRKFIDSLPVRLISDNQDEYEQYAQMRDFEPGTLIENVAVTTTDGPDIIPANNQMQGIEKVLAGENDDVFRLKNVLSEARDEYDFILIDTPANIGIMKDGALIAATNVVIPMQAETTSVGATRQHLEDIESMKDEQSFGLDMDVMAIVPNEVRDDGEAKNVTSIVRKQLPDSYWNHPERSKPDDFDASTLPAEFWKGQIYDDNGNLRDGIPEVLEPFWNLMGCRPLITDNKDYTDKVVDFDIRTRVAIRRAYSHNRTLFTHDEPCDMKQRFEQLATLIQQQVNN